MRCFGTSEESCVICSLALSTICPRIKIGAFWAELESCLPRWHVYSVKLADCCCKWSKQLCGSLSGFYVDVFGADSHTLMKYSNILIMCKIWWYLSKMEVYVNTHCFSIYLELPTFSSFHLFHSSVDIFKKSMPGNALKNAQLIRALFRHNLSYIIFVFRWFLLMDEFCGL